MNRRVSPRLYTKRSGFTLLEVMIALVVLAVGLVGVFQLQSQSLSMAAHSRFLTTAALLAQSKMAEIDAAASQDIASGSGDFGEDFPDFSWQIRVSDTEVKNFKRIDVAVTNQRMKANNVYTLVLYKLVGRSS